MANTFLTFQKFNDIVLAQTMVEQLNESGIACILEDNRHQFDLSFSTNTVGLDICIKVKPQDFTKARKALENIYQQMLEKVEDDYYLLAFSDEELLEIILKPDEWGLFDYQLAKKLLKERGKEIREEDAEQLKKARNTTLATPDQIGLFWLFAGYLSAVLGGILGLAIGGNLALNKKTLPDGQRVYAYADTIRRHGWIMLLLSILSSISIYLLLKKR